MFSAISRHIKTDAPEGKFVATTVYTRHKKIAIKQHSLHVTKIVHGFEWLIIRANLLF